MSKYGVGGRSRLEGDAGEGGCKPLPLHYSPKSSQRPPKAAITHRGKT